MKKAVLFVMLSGVVGALAADNGYIKTRVEPGRAGVFIDGKYVGPAKNFGMARTYPVAPGEHEIRLVEPRYEDSVKKVTVVAGKKTVLSESLKALPPAKPPFGVIRVEHPDHFAAVYVNGRLMGHVDEFSNFAQGLKINPGSYEVKVVPVSSGSPLSRTVTVEANKTVIVK